MLNLYQIDERLVALLDGDPETGEVDVEAIERFSMMREQKIENTALYIKDLQMQADAIKFEIDRLTAMKKATDSKAEWLKKYLADSLQGNNFKTARVTCSFRNSERVEFDNQDKFVEWAKANNKSLLKYAEPTVDKVAIKKAINGGDAVPFAFIEKRKNISVK